MERAQQQQQQKNQADNNPNQNNQPTGTEDNPKDAVGSNQNAADDNSAPKSIHQKPHASVRAVTQE